MLPHPLSARQRSRSASGQVWGKLVICSAAPMLFRTTAGVASVLPRKRLVPKPSQGAKPGRGQLPSAAGFVSQAPSLARGRSTHVCLTSMERKFNAAARPQPRVGFCLSISTHLPRRDARGPAPAIDYAVAPETNSLDIRAAAAEEVTAGHR